MRMPMHGTASRAKSRSAAKIAGRSRAVRTAGATAASRSSRASDVDSVEPSIVVIVLDHSVARLARRYYAVSEPGAVALGGYAGHPPSATAPGSDTRTLL